MAHGGQRRKCEEGEPREKGRDKRVIACLCHRGPNFSNGDDESFLFMP